ncbi:hypothetical protein NE865_03141 [Phthorimaea operculella]|nr:hypothetical protein NE865_03141 [Phthorimaea operculella]
MLQRLICNIICSLTKSIRKEAELPRNDDDRIQFHIPTLLVELLVLIITSKALNKYAEWKNCDRHLDELLDESKEAVRLTDEFLEKWRMRKVATETSYSDNEPQEFRPSKLELPILHMAFIDARGSTRKHIERADAGDALSYSDSAIISVVSLTEQGNETAMLADLMGDDFDDLGHQDHYLWDVEEEDPNVQY